MKLNLILMAISVLFLSCGSSNDPDPNYDNEITELNKLELYDAISLVNEWKFEQPKITSFVNPDQLIVQFPDGREVKKDLPVDKMYIAIAPYINFTHTCSTHYPSSCQGELTNKSMIVKARDENNNIVIEEDITTMKNGFFELWLPRNKSIIVHIEYDGKSVDQALTTNKDSKTCITTALLK